MKYLFTTIIATLLSLGTFAQTEFAPVGAKWTYRKISGGNFGFGSEYLTKSFCDSSYLNDGKTIKIIRSERYTQRFQYNNYASEWQFFDRDTISIVDSFYEQNDTVFAYNRLWQRFTPLYIYNVQEGDTITLPAFDTTLANINPFASKVSECVSQFDSTFSFRIDSIRTINYNGTALETYFTSPVFTIDWVNPYVNSSQPYFEYVYKTNQLVSNWSTNIVDIKTINPANPNTTDSPRLIYPTGAYVKNIGGLGGGFFPANELTHNNQVADVPLHYVNNLNCYSDSQLNVQFRPQHCDSFRYNAPLSLKKLNTLSNINIYPNPVKDLLHFELETGAQDMKLKIVNLLGSIQMSEIGIKQHQNTIDVSNLVPGIYLIVIEKNGERFYHKFVKQ